MNELQIVGINHKESVTRVLGSLVTFLHPEIDVQYFSLSKGRYGADYGELRALEFFKNSKYRHGGVVHYRRAFELNLENAYFEKDYESETRFIKSWNWSNNPETNWSSASILSLLSEVDLIFWFEGSSQVISNSYEWPVRWSCVDSELYLFMHLALALQSVRFCSHNQLSI